MTQRDEVLWIIERLRQDHRYPIRAEVHPETWAELKREYCRATRREDDESLSGKDVIGLEVDLNNPRRSVVIILQ